jgi:hypothetical protein
VSGDSPDTVSGGQGRDSGEGVHTGGRERIPLMAVYRWKIAPAGEGLTGRGRNAPSPVSCVSTRHPFPREIETPPPPGRCRGLLPPPPEGAGKCLAIAPDTVSGEQEQDFSQGCSHRAADLLILAGTLYRWDIAPVGVGLTGRGRNAPSPVAACHWIHPRLPARSAPPPAPSRGGGQVSGD